MSTVNIEKRSYIEVNTDPQRRCYNGCHYKSEFMWTAWSVLEEGILESKAEERIKFWEELNAYAVSQRGKYAKCEFRIV